MTASLQNPKIYGFKLRDIDIQVTDEGFDSVLLKLSYKGEIALCLGAPRNKIYETADRWIRNPATGRK